MNPEFDSRLAGGASVRLHIERLVLDGLPLAGGDPRTLGAGLEAELVRLLTEGGLGNQTSAAVPNLAGKTIHVAQSGTRSDGMGRQIARSVYGALNGSAAAIAAPREGGR